MAKEIVFVWKDDCQAYDGERHSDSVLMAGSFVVGSYRNEGLPQPACRLPGVSVDTYGCFTQLDAKARVEDAVERWFAEVMPNG